jgi:tetratricopeptide (TPR) repeat protein
MDLRFSDSGRGAFNAILRVREVRTMAQRIEKTVFLSYRRTNAPWALSIYHNLTSHGYDVFFDFNGIASGDFESVIIENIRSRAHFIVLLTPSALERCSEPEDWLRREIEMALAIQRNIVPLMLEGFDFGSPGIASQLTGTLAPLRKYNALRVPAEYFDEAMDRLRTKFLNVPLEAVLHPASPAAARAARTEQEAANAAPAVKERELTAQEYFERGFNTADPDDKLHFYSEAIRLKPDDADAYYNRGLARHEKGELDLAIQDYDQAIHLKPHNANPFTARGNARQGKGDLDGALQDYKQAIAFQPDDPTAYYNRAEIWQMKDAPATAIADAQKYLDLGGGERHRNKEEVKQMIAELKQKL